MKYLKKNQRALYFSRFGSLIVCVISTELSSYEYFQCVPI